jgi:hypothetical protein
MENPIRPSRPTRPSPARTRAPLVPDRRAPPVGARVRASLHFLSPSRCSVGPTCGRRFFFARVRSLSASRTQPVSVSLTLRPCPSPWTRPRPRVLQPPPHSLGPLEPHAPLAHFPLLTCALSRALSPPLSPCVRNQTSSTAAHQRRSSFRDRRWARIMLVPSVRSTASPAARDTIRFALSPSGLPGPRSPEHFLRSWSLLPSTRGLTASPPSSRRS